MAMETQPKLYRLQHSAPYFYAGYLKDKTQVFMSPDYPHLFAVFFDAKGKYLEYVIREMSPETRSAMAEWFESGWRLSQDEDYAKQWEDLDRWAAELDFTEGTISIQKFCLLEHKLCIHDLPEIYQEMIDANELDEDTEDAIQAWKEAGLYVFICWGQDFDIDARERCAPRECSITSHECYRCHSLSRQQYLVTGTLNGTINRWRLA